MTEIHISSFICNITVSWFLSILRKSTRRPDVFSCFKGRKLYCGVESVKRAEFSVLNVFNHNAMSTQRNSYYVMWQRRSILLSLQRHWYVRSNYFYIEPKLIAFSILGKLGFSDLFITISEEKYMTSANCIK